MNRPTSASARPPVAAPALRFGAATGGGPGLTLGEEPRNNMPIELHGNWQWGSAYDLHTISSEHYVDQYGHDQWNNTRSPMGQLVYRLKYQSDRTVVDQIINLLLSGYNGLESAHYLIPIPPSKARHFQPVNEICSALARRLNRTVLTNVLFKNTGSTELKGIDDPNQRAQALRSSMGIMNCQHLAGKTILLVDDLYRSGSTLQTATELLHSTARVRSVFVLTMTKTRSKR
jgi:competence protein ComFC